MLPHKKIHNFNNLHKLKMQPKSIKLEKLKCLKDLFDAKENGVYPLFLNQIKHTLFDLTNSNDINALEIQYLIDNVENKVVAEYLENIRNEMFDRHAQILIF